MYMYVYMYMYRVDLQVLVQRDGVGLHAAGADDALVGELRDLRGTAHVCNRL